jgi:hypothetical protein
MASAADCDYPGVDNFGRLSAAHSIASRMLWIC